jgi:hypothetical protein
MRTAWTVVRGDFRELAEVRPRRKEGEKTAGRKEDEDMLGASPGVETELG